MKIYNVCESCVMGCKQDAGKVISCSKYKGPIKNAAQVDLHLRAESSVDKAGLTDMRRVGLSNRKIKEQIKERDAWVCYICGRETNLHVHHITPRALGGTDNPDNLVTLCAGCHRSVEAGDVENAMKKCVQRALNNQKGEMIMTDPMNLPLELEKLEALKELPESVPLLDWWEEHGLEVAEEALRRAIQAERVQEEIREVAGRR